MYVLLRGGRGGRGGSLMPLRPGAYSDIGQHSHLLGIVLEKGVLFFFSSQAEQLCDDPLPTHWVIEER